MIVEYKEVYSKTKGYYYRILDLKKYIDDLPHECKGKDKGKIICECPYCCEVGYLTDESYHGKPYRKHKLYIEEGEKRGFCHRCSGVYLHTSDDDEFELPEIVAELTSFSQLDFSMNAPKWPRDLYHRYTQLSDYHKTRMYERNPYTANFWDLLGFKSLDENRMLVPFMWDSGVLFYQVWQEFLDPKYFTPPIKNKPLYICGPLKSKAILVEGVFDAVACLTLYPDHTPIALIGSYLTPAQSLMLRALPIFSEILVYMDWTNLSYKIYNQLKYTMDFSDIRVIPSEGQDPEEKLKEFIKKYYDNSN